MEIEHINSMITVFRERRERYHTIYGKCKSAFDSRPYILRFCAANSTTRHLVSLTSLGALDTWCLCNSVVLLLLL